MKDDTEKSAEIMAEVGIVRIICRGRKLPHSLQLGPSGSGPQGDVAARDQRKELLTEMGKEAEEIVVDRSRAGPVGSGAGDSARTVAFTDSLIRRLSTPRTEGAGCLRDYSSLCPVGFVAM